VKKDCPLPPVNWAQNEFIVVDLDAQQTVFKTDSAFYIY